MTSESSSESLAVVGPNIDLFFLQSVAFLSGYFMGEEEVSFYLVPSLFLDRMGKCDGLNRLHFWRVQDPDLGREK